MYSNLTKRQLERGFFFFFSFLRNQQRFVKDQTFSSNLMCGFVCAPCLPGSWFFLDHWRHTKTGGAEESSLVTWKQWTSAFWWLLSAQPTYLKNTRMEPQSLSSRQRLRSVCTLKKKSQWDRASGSQSGEQNQNEKGQENRLKWTTYISSSSFKVFSGVELDYNISMFQPFI